ncbi:MAG: F0F1 ATP synthase subunit A [bacterium]
METNSIVAAAAQLQARIDAVQAFTLHHVQNSNILTLPYLEIELPISIHALMLLVGSGILLLLFGVLYRKKAAVPTGITNLLELFVVFVRDEISVRYLGEKDGRRLAPLFCSFFFFILTLNMIGLVPGFASATGNISVTAALAMVTFCFMVFGAIIKVGVLGFIKGLVPGGIPVPMQIMLFPLEVIGLLIKTGALMIRLFANMFSGHMVLFLLIGMVMIFGVYALPVIALAVFVYVLELFVAFLQAYIFTLLSAIFIGQRFHPEH